MNNSYAIVRIQRYLNGELSPEEMYELEREALDDPLLQDAIDGYRLQQHVSHRQLSLLQQRLADRVATQAKERNAFFFGWQRLGVAATACVLMVLVLVLFWMRHQSAKQQPAGKEVQVELTSPEMLTGTRVVAGIGADLDAYPEGGWDTFQLYLAGKLNSTPVKEKATLTFEIDKQGIPRNIQVVGDIDDRLLQDIRQALEQGPRWSGSKGELEVMVD